MKKTKQFFLIITLVMALVTLCSCVTTPTTNNKVEIKANFPESFEVSDVLNIDFASYITVTDEGDENAIITNDMIDTSKVDSSTAGRYLIIVEYISSDDKLYTSRYYVTFVDKTIVDPTKPTTQYDKYEPQLQNKFKEHDDKFLGNGLPSIGTPKILVVPVEFSDYTLTSSGYTTSDIQKGFFGGTADTGWESVASYYRKSSYDHLNISGDVTPVYRAKNKSTYYNNSYNNGNWGELYLLKEVLDYFDDSIDFSQYDYDKDGSLDGIYLVYTHEQDYESDSVWWAWQDFAASYSFDPLNYDGIQVNYYMWASVHFFSESVDVGNGYDRFGNEATNGMILNAHTLIHETGHMLGLDDYYDYADYYNVGPTGGLGGADIMDYTVGDHCPFSKTMLGWVNPVVALDTVTLEIRSFTETGDCIMIAKDYNSTGYFGEYLLIDLYTPTGLNEMDKDYLFTKTGVRIMQADATINNNFDVEKNRSLFLYNNIDTAHKQIRYIEANGQFDIEKSTSTSDVYADNNDLFDAGDIFQITSSNWRNLTWYDGTPMNFTIKVDSIVNNVATITITFK